MSDPPSMRVADADREQLASDLREHMLVGRLSSEEFEDRVGRAYRASTRGELDELRADLPMSPAIVQAAVDQRHRRLRRRLAQEAGGGLGVSLMCVAIWLASGANGSFWPVWVIIGTMLPVVRNSWRLLGPAPDPESVEAQLRSRQARRLAREGRHAARHRGLPR